MNWEIVAALVGALGLGAILTKLLDIFWLERISHEHERRKWLRDQRLSAYVDLTKHLLSFGLSRGAQHDNPFEGYVVVSKAMLLAHDEDLAKKIDRFIVDLDRYFLLQNEGKDAEAEALYEELWDRARGIVGNLRTSLAPEQALHEAIRSRDLSEVPLRIGVTKAYETFDPLHGGHFE